MTSIGERTPSKPKTFRLMLPVFVGLFVGIVVLTKSMDYEVKFDEVALGDTTTVSMASVDNVRIHCGDLRDFAACNDGYIASGRGDAIVWLGNSQIHAINQFKKNDETAAPALHQFFRKMGFYFLTFSQPNANLQEHYLLFEYLVKKIQIKYLILPVVFDDMREAGVRPSLQEILSDVDVVSSISENQIGRKLLANIGDKDSAGNDMAALEDTLQESTEKFLNQNLSGISELWAKRSSLRGKTNIALYRFRNWSLGINPSSVRKKIPARYFANMETFKTILNSAVDRGVRVLVYIVPLRGDVAIPYNAHEYREFKEEISLLSDRDGVRFINLESIVPGKLWGTKDSTSLGEEVELDFMHFKAQGHGILAKHLQSELLEFLNGGERR